MKILATLRQRKKELLDEAAELNAKDTLTDDEQSRLAELMGEDGDDSIARLNAKIDRQIQIDEERRNSEAALDLDDAEADRSDQATIAAGGAARVTESRGFETFGDQLFAIASAGMNDGNRSAWDQRLVYNATAGANEATPSEGGFLVQQDFSTALLGEMHDVGNILSRVRRLPLGGNSNGTKLPVVDESSRANGSRFGGVRAYWANEGDTVAASKPKLRALKLELEKLMGIGYATEELLQDSDLLEAVMRPAFLEEMTFVAEDAIVNGDGAGKPLGYLNSGALVTVDKESGQASATIVAMNILNMWSRTPIRSRKNLIWLVNQDVEPQLWGLTYVSGDARALLYTPPGVNGNNSEFGLLMGRPVIPIEYAATLGAAGDIQLIDPQAYATIDKNGIKQASSMHVRFLYDEMAFRFTFRIDGKPVWNKAVTPFKGSNTISPYVVLQAR